MAIPIQNIVQRLRWKVDLEQDQKNTLTQDGSTYVHELTNSPVISGSDTVYLQHTTNTTGVPQFVYRNGTQPASITGVNNIVYTIDYDRGELRFYQGSGTFIASTGLVPFAPWSTADVIAYYKSSIYTDNTLADYASYAVAPVENRLQIGMFVSGISGVFRPRFRDILDEVHYREVEPYEPTEKVIVAEDVEILQDLIAQKAQLDIVSRERRVGAGDAIKIVDGDTQIDTSVNQRHLRDFVKDLQDEYERNIKAVLFYMAEGYTLKQINELPFDQFQRAGTSGRVRIE